MIPLDASVASLILGSSGIGGIIAWRKMGADKAAVVVGYQGEIITDLNADRDRLHEENRKLRNRISSLETENLDLRTQVGKLADRVKGLEERVS